MDYKIVYGLVIIFLLVQIFMLRSRLKKVYEYMSNVFDMSKQMIEQYESYKMQAKELKGYFEVVKKSSDAVNEHYNLMKNRMAIITKALEILMNNNKKQEEKENGMAV